MWLIETRVVFECSSSRYYSSTIFRLIETRVVFELIGIVLMMIIYYVINRNKSCIWIENQIDCKIIILLD